MVQGATLEDVARRAVDGDREALDSLVQALQGGIYGLAVRMLWNREDAEDATQEILVRVVTRLSQFDFRSKLKTWVYRVAVNYILDVKTSPVERMHGELQALKEVLRALGFIDSSDHWSARKGTLVFTGDVGHGDICRRCSTSSTASPLRRTGSGGGSCGRWATTISTWTGKAVRAERSPSGTDSGRKSRKRRCTLSDTPGWS